jgi:hypothetical protein
MLKRARELQEQSAAIYRELWNDTAGGNPDFAGDLKAMLGGERAISAIQDAGNNFASTLQLYGDLYDGMDGRRREEFIRVSEPNVRALQHALDGLIVW